MQKSITVCAIVVILVVSFGLAGCSKTETAKEDIPLVRSQVVTKDATGQTAVYSGEVRGRHEVILAFQVGGKITQRNVELGSVVNSGDVLMEMDAQDLQQAVNMSAAQVSSTKSQLSLAATNIKRFRNLYEQDAVSLAQLEQYQNAYDIALAAFNQASSQYNQVANQLSYCSLVADSDGVIANVNAEAGQVVNAGQPVLTLVQGSEREIEIYVPENRINDTRNAQKIDISFWALPGVTAEGKIREISPVVDQVTRTCKVRINLSSPPKNISLGMTASVKVVNSVKQQSIYIPLAAIYQIGDTPSVWVIQDGIVKLRPIKVGAFGDETVQVLEGLQNGDVIVTAGAQKLREGQKVRYE
ncbi:RND family efflux transporter, MFP subunit [Desulfotomaculum arcticum]|uniref:RND family efflux transporter, MFP subunit n=1 Tax=Desulfotruncus arcticus DSM 17038 TaxID=1121424 RepID=A0A1I2XP82_9FIRM|nr:efflux RND transporter periplasmic adaptor subunit [Desulfotruncus arcticus]SFH15308.1 RND family efflux transporter, MFP subunit [Desulfotomaculum arcticum] [Desulfotruncus arcticus DSM 17038]